MLNSILNQLNQLNSEELKTLNKAVVEMAKAKSRIASVTKSASLFEGQEVEIDHPSHRGEKFIIKKINRTRCKVRSLTNTLASYNVPMNMIIA